LLDFFEEDVELAIAAYNAGETAVVQAGNKIPRFAETQRYVPKVLSIYKKAKRMT
jgi:soluble lytic murein transglycosylase-like protein